MEIAETKGNALEGFNSVVTAFGESIRVRTVKSIEDIRHILPVL